jgi:hypothetical protein
VFLRPTERAQAEMRWTVAEKNYLCALKFDKRNSEAAAALGDFYFARTLDNADPLPELELKTIGKHSS